MRDRPVTFSPTATGTRTGILTVQFGAGALPVTTLTGNGVDFSIDVNPGSGSVIAGYAVTPLLRPHPSQVSMPPSF